MFLIRADKIVTFAKLSSVIISWKDRCILLRILFRHAVTFHLIVASNIFTQWLFLILGYTIVTFAILIVASITCKDHCILFMIRCCHTFTYRCNFSSNVFTQWLLLIFAGTLGTVTIIISAITYSWFSYILVTFLWCHTSTVLFIFILNIFTQLLFRRAE